MERFNQLQELTWKDVRMRVYMINPILADIIDQIDPNDSYTFFYARYSYGDEALVSGKMFLPNENDQLVPFEDSSISQNIKNKIGYNLGTNPMTLVLKNTLDLYISLEKRIAMYALINEGSVFGTWQVFDQKARGNMIYTPIPLWDMTAGARSIFMLPKISEANAFGKLRKKYDLKSEPPKKLGEHWKIFKEIANHPTFEEKWETELLFFSHKWIESIHDLAWYKLKSYLSDAAWGGSEFWRNQFCWDLTFSRIQERRGIRPCPYAADIANHLLAMSVGAVPGFQPLIDDKVAPVRKLMEVFQDEYGSRYAPILIGPAYFNVLQSSKNSIFYTFQYQTALKLSQKSSNRSSVVTDLYNVRSLLNKYIQEIQNSELKIDGTILYELAKKITFNCYHYAADEGNKMIASNTIFKENKLFEQAMDLGENDKFPKNAPFLNGCIEVTI